MSTKIRQLLAEETGGVHLRFLFARLILAFLPMHAGNRLRSVVLRLAGFDIGHGTFMADTPTIAGVGDIYKRLHIGKSCYFNIGCFFDLNADIRIDDNVSCGQQVMLLTHTHEIGYEYRRAGKLLPLPVHIEDGVWLGARCIILPGVTVGRGAVVAAGAVVTKDVVPQTLVAGVPARVIRQLDQINE
ncbi:MAG: acyltransferase [Candidatus Promineifilaceae bacterium]